jgi:hypothetical protein
LPRTRESDEEKRAVLDKIAETAGPVSPVSGSRRDWVVSADRRLSVFATFSQSSQLFYDVARADLKEWQTYQASFVAFVAGSRDRVFVVPVPELDARLSRHHPVKDRGNYKLHLDRTGRDWAFREIPGFSLAKYENNYAQLQTSQAVNSTSRGQRGPLEESPTLQPSPHLAAQTRKRIGARPAPETQSSVWDRLLAELGLHLESARESAAEHSRAGRYGDAKAGLAVAERMDAFVSDMQERRCEWSKIIGSA